jgi:putative acetyltransferase
MMMRIRLEGSGDIEAIHEVETTAFGRDLEADLVDRLRENVGVTLSLVAEVEGKIVGHILFSPVTVEDGEEVFATMSLGPVAVLPEKQNQGIGSALVREGLDHLREMGHELIFLVGHPTYYPRFGFVPAMAQGFDCAYTQPDSPNAHFMVVELRQGALTGKRGFMRYRPEFEGV